MQQILFYFFAALAVISAFWVILLPKPTRALLSLIVTMFSLSVLYILLGAPFIAMAHLIVYAGAVLVLFLFVIMLQGIGAKDIPIAERFSSTYFLLVFFTTAAFVGFIGYLSKFMIFPNEASTAGFSGQVELVAATLFRDYIGPFELTSLLLLVGVFAAVSLAKKEDPQ